MTAKPLALALMAALALAGCAKKITPPGDPGVCYHVVPQKDGSLKYNKLVTVDTLERCAANLEAMRLKFLTMGGSNQRLTGAFQSNFLFLVPQGVMTASSYEGPQWTLLVRSGDGRLVNPAAMPQQ